MSDDDRLLEHPFLVYTEGAWWYKDIVGELVGPYDTRADAKLAGYHHRYNLAG